MKMIVFQFKLEFYQSILTTSEFNKKETTGILFWIKFWSFDHHWFRTKQLKKENFDVRLLNCPHKAFTDVKQHLHSHSRC